MSEQRSTDIRELVKERYAAAATSISEGGCAPTGSAADGLIGASLYDDREAATLPAAALAASLGCGNPALLAALTEGQVVLDLGSGGGIDVLLSARRVGPTGMAYGLDMTPEMLDLARQNQRDAGIENAAFLEGTIESVPLPDEAVDVIISNCVVNLSPDKPAVLREAFRVLRHDGRLAISDIVLARPISEHLVSLMGLWTGCVAGALTDEAYRELLDAQGFEDAEVVPTNVYDRPALISMAGELDMPKGVDAEQVLGDLDGAVMSAFVKARKP